MDHVAPAGPVYQAGTLSANPLAMRAGLATLERLTDGSVYAQLESLGAELEAGVADIAGMTIVRKGSVFWLTPETSPSCTHRAVTDKHRELYPGWFTSLLERGIYLPPSPYEVCFLSAAHTSADITALLEGLAALQ